MTTSVNVIFAVSIHFEALPAFGNDAIFSPDALFLLPLVGANVYRYISGHLPKASLALRLKTGAPISAVVTRPEYTNYRLCFVSGIFST